MQGSATVSPARRLFQQWRKVVVGILLMVLAFGAWRFVISPTYWRVATFPQYKRDYSYAVFYSGLEPCVNGFCLRETKFTFVLRDWRQGREIWRVTSAQPDTRGWPRSDNDEASYAYAADVSSNGRVLAVMSAAGKKARLQSWRDGKLLGEVLIPIPPASPPAAKYANRSPIEKHDRLSDTLIQACDDGRCFLTLEFVPAGQEGVVSHLFLVRGNSIIASGAVPAYCWTAPDGRSANLYDGTDRLSLLTVNGQKLVFSKGHAATISLIGTRGMAVTDTGILRLDGKPTTLKERWVSSELCPSARYATIYRENRLRAVEVATGRHWQVSVGAEYEMLAGDPTEDGRHVVAYYRQKPSPMLLRLADLAARFWPGLREHFEERQSSVQYAALYRRPHRRLAAMRMIPYSSCWPSPDGRTFVIGTEKGECRLLRYVGP